MDSNSGLPPEILVLCTTTETKEKAVKLLDWIRHMPDIHRELALEPAMPAICSLIASEQLGSTVVTERRAQQWSQSTPEHFRAIMGKVQKLLIASRMHHQPRKGHLSLPVLAAELCPDQSALGRIMMVEKAFREANGRDRWHLESDLVQLSLFLWSCRQFKLRTFKSVEDIQLYHDLPAASLNEIYNFLDENCHSRIFTGIFSPHRLPVLDVSKDSPRPSAVPSPSVSHETATHFEGTSSADSSVRLEDLAREFGIADDVMGGMRYLDKMVRESEDFKHLVNWNSTMGRCVVFYWTCSVLKVPGAKHITLRNRFQLGKKEFDKILSTLDLQRGDLRRKLDTFYAGNPVLQTSSQSTQWTATSAVKPPHVPPAPDVIEQSTPAVRTVSGTGSAKRGRPPKQKSPPPVSLDPVSKQETELLSLCTGAALRRALLLLRSFNAKNLSVCEAERIPSRSLPAIVALVASRQLGDGQIGERQAIQASHMLDDVFVAALGTVRASVDVFEPGRPFASHTTFDDLALEHGLGIDTIVSMMHVRDALKESRCLSIGMDWESPLVKCSVFFWTCAILKVPDVKQTLLRSRSLVSKREFDSMLQLLNSHCAVVRHRLEKDSAHACIFAPPPYTPPRPIIHQETGLDAHNSRPKRAKRDTMTPSDVGSEALDTQPCYAYVPSKKPGRPAGYRKVLQREESSETTVLASVPDVGLSQTGPPQTGPPKTGPPKTGPPKTGPPKTGPSQTGPSQTGPLQTGPSQTGPSQTGPPRTSPPDLGPIYIPSAQFPPADWKPPESLSNTTNNSCVPSSVCPPSETGESKRRHTRYSTTDYQTSRYDRIDIWKPDGEEIRQQQTQYRRWEEKMAQHYGPQWEKNISHEKPGIPFE